MNASTDQNFPTPESGPNIFSAPFKIQTNWHVIKGAPCSGKTTLIDLLSGKGHQTVPEIGRKYIKEKIAKGRTLAEIRADDIAFCYVIKDLQLETEHGLRPEDVIFLDRGFPDCLAFFRM